MAAQLRKEGSENDVHRIFCHTGQKWPEWELADSCHKSSTEFARGPSCAGPKEAWSLEQGWEQVGCGSAPPSNRVAQDTICPLSSLRLFLDQQMITVSVGTHCKSWRGTPLANPNTNHMAYSDFIHLIFLAGCPEIFSLTSTQVYSSLPDL